MKEFYFGYDIDNISAVQDFVISNYKSDEYEMSIGYGDDVMNYLKMKVNLSDSRGEELSELIDNCEDIDEDSF